MKMKGNDKLILELKAQVEAKKKLLKGSGKFSPKTNCSLLLDGERHNLNVIDKGTCLLLLAKLKSLQSALTSIYPDEQLMINSYSAEIWMHDLMSRFNVVNRQSEEQRLKVLEERLHL